MSSQSWNWGLLFTSEVPLTTQLTNNGANSEDGARRQAGGGVLPNNGTRNQETCQEVYGVRKKTPRVKSLVDDKLATARLDLMFLLLFPCFFVLFNLVYWFSFLYVVPGQREN